jgi:hypothetical protein
MAKHIALICVSIYPSLSPFPLPPSLSRLALLMGMATFPLPLPLSPISLAMRRLREARDDVALLPARLHALCM